MCVQTDENAAEIERSSGPVLTALTLSAVMGCTIYSLLIGAANCHQANQKTC